jgi:hypothetical protein
MDGERFETRVHFKFSFSIIIRTRISKRCREEEEEGRGGEKLLARDVDVHN